MSQHVLWESRGKQAFLQEYDAPWNIEGIDCNF